MSKKSDDYGLAGFGRGGLFDEAWVGAALGATAQSGAAAATRAFAGGYEKWSEGIGAVAGLAVGAGLYFTGYRDSGKVAMAVAVANGVVRVAERLLKGGSTAGIGYPVINSQTVFQGANGFGIATMEPTTVFNGAGQFAGPPQLANGFGNLPGAHQAQLEGGPATSSLAGMYGATLFGGN